MNQKIQRLFFHINNSSTKSKTSLKRLSTSSKVHQGNRLAELFFPTLSPLNEQVAKLNQHAVDVQTGIKHSISSLHTQRLQYLTSIDEKTRGLERAAAAFESSSSKHLKRELDKTKKLSYIFKIAIILCLSLFSFMLGYMIIQLIRDKGIL